MALQRFDAVVVGAENCPKGGYAATCLYNQAVDQ